MVEHTPGPWTIEDPEDYPNVVNCDVEDNTAVCWGPSRAANASLVALAPEMLEACQEMFELLHGPSPDLGGLETLKARLTEIMAKTGG